MYKYLLLISFFCSQFICYSQKLDTLIIESVFVKELRKINIWTPKDYLLNEEKYPVVYLLDGGIKEDFPHVQETIQKLIDENKIPPVILVGIENTNRRRDFTGVTTSSKDKKLIPHYGGSEQFRLFLQEELIYFIQKHYRANNERTIMGESLAGLFIIETFFTHPEIFKNYIAYDPSLWWNKSFLVKESLNKISKLNYKGEKLWFAGSSTKDIQKNTRLLEQKLNNIPSSSFTWVYSDEPKEKHNTIFQACKEKSLIWTLNNN
ncbi:MAG TPA: alpha/beta hydrolase-fold protein [Bacteroidia bacterium]